MRKSAYQIAVELWEATGLPTFPVGLYSDGEKLQKRPMVKWGGMTRDSHPGDFNWRGSNALGLPTGERSGLIAIDLDDYKEGTGDIALWLQKHDIDLDEPETRMHRTASGGTHLIYRMPEGHDLGNCAPAVHGLDVRGNGGYIVWADLQGRYGVLSDQAPAELPESVLSELVAANEGRGRIVRDADVRMPNYAKLDVKALEARLHDLTVGSAKALKLRQRWAGETDGMADVSRSAMDMSAASLLAAQGFTYDEIAWALLHRFRHGVVARDGQTDAAERSVLRCAYRATRQTEETRVDMLAKMLSGGGTIDERRARAVALMRAKEGEANP